MFTTGCEWAQILDLILERNGQGVSHSTGSIWSCGRLLTPLQTPRPQERGGRLPGILLGTREIRMTFHKDFEGRCRGPDSASDVQYTHTHTERDCQHFLEDQAVAHLLPASASLDEVTVICLDWSCDLQALIPSADGEESAARFYMLASWLP